MAQVKEIEGLRSMGFVLLAVDGEIRHRSEAELRPPEADDLLAEVMRRKEEAVAYLSIPWPQVCRESEWKFGHAPARLYPMLNKVVSTPQGRGTLWQVGSERVGVVLNRQPGKVTFMPFWDVRPIVRRRNPMKIRGPVGLLNQAPPPKGTLEAVIRDGVCGNAIEEG